MDTACYISSGAFQTRDLATIVGIAREHGITRLELSSGLRYSEDLMEVVSSNKETLNFLVHNYFPPPPEPFVLNLAADDPMQLEQSRGHCKRAIDLTVELGGGVYTVHSGFAFRASPEMLGREGLNYSLIPMERAKAIFEKSLRVIVRYARSQGVMILIENNVISSRNLIQGENLLGLGVTAADLIEILEEVGSPSLGLLIDVGHLKVSANTLGFDRLKFIERLKEHIKAFHLSDNNGLQDQNLPFEDDVWFLPILKGFREATFILEAYYLEVPRILMCRELISKAVTGSC